MSLLESLVRLFAPHACVTCQAEDDRLLCEGCTQSLALVPSRCYRCKAVTQDYAVCASCRKQTALQQVAVYTFYQAAAKELVQRVKYERARAGAQDIAALLAELTPAFPAGVVLVHVPTATRRVRTRGYDQARLIARALSKSRQLPHRTYLARLGQQHQVGARRTARLRQLRFAFRAVHDDDIRGRHVVLVDDVLTTGATLEMAAWTLKRAGAVRVSALVFAQA